MAQGICAIGAYIVHNREHTGVVGDAVVAIDPLVNNLIQSLIASDGIVASTTYQNIITCSSIYIIIPRSTMENIVANLTRNSVVPCIGPDDVISIGTRECKIP